MKYRPPVLNIASALFLIGVLVYAAWNHKTLSEGEGWGMVAIFGLIGIALSAAVLDFILQLGFDKMIYINIVGAIIVVGYALALLYC